VKVKNPASADGAAHRARDVASMSAMGEVILRPDVWSGRAMQEVLSIPADAVLHQCIRPLIGASAPGHHGYQRACDLITG
jgi:hypothetical protein